MLDKKYFVKIRQQLLAYAEQRREMIKLSGDAQHLAKRAIFALQRDNTKEGEEGLAKAKEILLALNKKFAKVDKIFNEGSYKASLEEYVEAKTFFMFVSGKAIDKLPIDSIGPEEYINGLTDLSGELVRQAVLQATKGNYKVLESYRSFTEEIVGFMLNLYLTGSSRQKFDDAKRNLKRLEQIIYEVKLRG